MTWRGVSLLSESLILWKLGEKEEKTVIVVPVSVCGSLAVLYLYGGSSSGKNY